MLDECYDMELYDWVKADINDPVRGRSALRHARASQLITPPRLLEEPFRSSQPFAQVCKVVRF